LRNPGGLLLEQWGPKKNAEANLPITRLSIPQRNLPREGNNDLGSVQDNKPSGRKGGGEFLLPRTKRTPPKLLLLQTDSPSPRRIEKRKGVSKCHSEKNGTYALETEMNSKPLT